MNNKKFAELEKVYLEEKAKRRALQKLIKDRQDLKELLEKLHNAKDSSFEEILDMKISCSISYSDCEGRREIDRDDFEMNITYEQFVNIIKEELAKIDKEMQSEKLRMCEE